MFRASVDDFGGYAHHAYGETAKFARAMLGAYILTETENPELTTVDDVDDYFGITVEPVRLGVFSEADPDRDVVGLDEWVWGEATRLIAANFPTEFDLVDD